MLRVVLLLCVLALVMRVTNSAISTEEFATLAAKTKPRPSRMPTKKPTKPTPSKPTKPTPSKPTKPTPSKPTKPSSPKPAFATRVIWNGINCGTKASTSTVEPPKSVVIEHILNVCSAIPVEGGRMVYGVFSVDGTSIKIKYFSDASCKTAANPENIFVTVDNLNVCKKEGPDSRMMQLASSLKEVADKFTSNRVTFVDTFYSDSACSNVFKVALQFSYDGCTKPEGNDYYHKYQFTSSGVSVDFFSSSDCTGDPVTNYVTTFEEMGFNQCTKGSGDGFYKRTTLSQSLLAN